MKIITEHKGERNTGIHTKSVEVDPLVHKKTAQELVGYINERNGEFRGNFKRAFALAHAQVADVKEPIKLFVVTEELTEKPKKQEKGVKNTEKNYYFPAQAIFNAEILEAPEKINRKSPKREAVETKDGKTEVQVTMEDKEVDNTYKVKEGCMSFPMRKEKQVKRFYRIKVRYQYIKERKILGDTVVTVEEEVEGLKSHIFQHECDHFAGKNIYHAS